MMDQEQENEDDIQNEEEISPIIENNLTNSHNFTNMSIDTQQLSARTLNIFVSILRQN
jgi:hypothetical protein